MIKFRRSVDGDLEGIERVFLDCFGVRDTEDVLVDVSGRYIVAYDTELKMIVGFAGVIPPEKSQYKGYEIDWSCTMQKYIRTTLLSNLLLEVMKDCDQDVYCESWRVEGVPETDLLRNLKKLGFELLVEAKNLSSSTYCKACDTCPMRNEMPNEDGVNECRCCWDLYVKGVD